MIKAIIYKSNTGFTRRYAEWLGERTGLPVYTQKDAEKAGAISKGDAVLFMGWIAAGKIQGFEDCWKRYEVPAVCTVGLYADTQKLREYLARNNILIDTELFCLPGGLNPEKLNLVQKLVLQAIVKDAQKKKARGEALTDDDRALITAWTGGLDQIDAGALDPVAAWYEKQ